MSWNPRPRRRPGWSPGGVRKVKALNPLPDLEEEVGNTTLTVPVVCGSAPIQEGWSSRTDVPFVSSAAVSLSMEDMVHSNAFVSSDVGIQLSILVQLDRCASKAMPETSRKAQQGIAARSREDLLGDVCSGFDRCLLGRSLQRTFSGVAANLETGWTLGVAMIGAQVR